MPMHTTKLTKDQKELIAKELRSQFKTKHPKVEAHFIRYNRLDRPVTDPGALPTSLKRITKAMYREKVSQLTVAETSLRAAERKAYEMERLLQRAILSATGNEDTMQGVIHDYVSNHLFGLSKYVQMEQWGDLSSISDKPGEYDLKQDLGGKLLARAKR